MKILNTHYPATKQQSIMRVVAAFFSLIHTDVIFRFVSTEIMAFDVFLFFLILTIVTSMTHNIIEKLWSALQPVKSKPEKPEPRPVLLGMDICAVLVSVLLTWYISNILFFDDKSSYFHSLLRAVSAIFIHYCALTLSIWLYPKIAPHQQSETQNNDRQTPQCG